MEAYLANPKLEDYLETQIQKPAGFSVKDDLFTDAYRSLMKAIRGLSRTEIDIENGFS